MKQGRKQFWGIFLIISNHFLSLLQVILGNLVQSRAISGNLRHLVAISGYLEISWDISSYLGLSWDISSYLGLSWDISCYIRLSVSRIKYQGASKSRREQVIAIWNFFFSTRAIPKGACAPKKWIMRNFSLRANILLWSLLTC